MILMVGLWVPIMLRHEKLPAPDSPLGEGAERSLGGKPALPSPSVALGPVCPLLRSGGAERKKGPAQSGANKSLCLNLASMLWRNHRPIRPHTASSAHAPHSSTSRHTHTHQRTQRRCRQPPDGTAATPTGRTPGGSNATHTPLPSSTSSSSVVGVSAAG